MPGCHPGGLQVKLRYLIHKTSTFSAPALTGQCCSMFHFRGRGAGGYVYLHRRIVYRQQQEHGCGCRCSRPPVPVQQFRLAIQQLSQFSSSLHYEHWQLCFVSPEAHTFQKCNGKEAHISLRPVVFKPPKAKEHFQIIFVPWNPTPGSRSCVS